MMRVEQVSASGEEVCVWDEAVCQWGVGARQAASRGESFGLRGWYRDVWRL